MDKANDKFIDSELKELINKSSLAKNAVLNCRLSDLSSIRSGGTCSCLIKIDTRGQLLGFLKGFISLKNPDIRLLPVGGATNILFNDGYLEMVLLKLGNDFNYLNISGDGCISAGAAVKLQKLVVESAKKGYDFSFLSGIPGTLGGAVAGNSGSAGAGIIDTIKRIKYVSYSGSRVLQQEKEISGKDYSYRNLNIPGMAIITDVFFNGRNVITENINQRDEAAMEVARKIIFQKIRRNIKNKKSSQPFNAKNAGCFFKNPPGSSFSAGKIIDMCGFKGFRYGDAQVSDMHANFIINSGSASSKDLYTLSAIVRDAVMQESGIELQYEVRLEGF